MCCLRCASWSRALSTPRKTTGWTIPSHSCESLWTSTTWTRAHTPSSRSRRRSSQTVPGRTQGRGGWWYRKRTPICLPSPYSSRFWTCGRQTTAEHPPKLPQRKTRSKCYSTTCSSRKYRTRRTLWRRRPSPATPTPPSTSPLRFVLSSPTTRRPPPPPAPLPSGWWSAACVCSWTTRGGGGFLYLGTYQTCTRIPRATSRCRTCTASRRSGTQRRSWPTCRRSSPTWASPQTSWPRTRSPSCAETRRTSAWCARGRSAKSTPAPIVRSGAGCSTCLRSFRTTCTCYCARQSVIASSSGPTRGRRSLWRTGTWTGTKRSCLSCARKWGFKPQASATIFCTRWCGTGPRSCTRWPLPWAASAPRKSPRC
mmetsp:Transcript_10707/g.25532  ORF Transcript_10707/g.25532 Transcript_10707/m.25532 type:complete len:368 (-) Transcript_10707:235-1338(-)